jgi:8-oxo-dGTP pyrophosphatase MutT (NUDIX family)
MAISSYYRSLRDRVGCELLIIPAVAAVLRDEHGRVLIQRDHHGNWSLPAGAIEPGEAPARAVAREVHEETGLRVRVERVLGVVGGARYRSTYPNGDRVEYVVTVFACTPVAGELIKSNDETSKLEWFSPDQVPALAFPYPDGVISSGECRAYFEWDAAWTGDSG